MATPLWSDNPSEKDLLGFADVTAPIVEAVLRDNLDPVTVGIEGDWGSGKTSMLKVLASELRENGAVVVIETHPWEYDPATDPKATLIAEVLGEVHAAVKDNQNFTEAVKNKFKALASRVQVSKAVKLAVTSAATGGLPQLVEVLGLFKEDAETVPDPTLQGFREEFRELMDMKALAEIDRVVVLVDDLDRCLPDTVIATLEAVKLFLSVPKMAFVVAADQRAVAQAIASNYEPSPLAAKLGQQYLEKIIQIPRRVPAVGLSDTRAYLALLMLERHLTDEAQKPFVEHCNARRAAGKADVLSDLPQEGLDADALDDLQLAKMLAPVLHADLEGNPRRVKRFLNDYWMRATIAGRRGISLEPPALAKLMVLEQLNDEGFQVLLGWLRETALDARLKALEERQRVDDVSDATRQQLVNWSKIGPKLAKTAHLDSYLRLAASLGSSLDVQAVLRGEVADIVEGLSGGVSQRRAMEKRVSTYASGTQVEAAAYLVDRIISSPEDQTTLATGLGKMAADPAVAAAMAEALQSLTPNKVHANLIAALLPDKDRQPPLVRLVKSWVDSERLQSSAQAVAKSKLEPQPPRDS